MYRGVSRIFASGAREWPVHVLPPQRFFYGIVGRNFCDIERGKRLVISCQALGEIDDEGMVKVFFELNGHPRVARVPDRRASMGRTARRQADADNPLHVAAPMPGTLALLSVSVGQEVHVGDLLLTLEAMRWKPRATQTVRA